MRWLIVVSLTACACPPKPGATPIQPAAGSADSATGCASVRGKIEQLYRADAQAAEPGRVDQRTADNTAMVMTECAKDPAKLVACVQGVSSAGELETKCLAPLDDEGTEGDRFKR